jgi:hypothetical protein
MSRPLIITKGKDSRLASGQWTYRDGPSKKVIGPSPVQVVHLRDLTIQPVREAKGNSPKVTAVPKKVTWLQTPLMLPERSRFLDVMFFPAPILSRHAAFHGLWILPLLLSGTVGVILPFILWGK